MTYYESILNQTAYHVERCYNDCCSFNSNNARRSMMDSAFGAISLASAILPCEELDNINKLWNEYKPKFENLIYGE